MTLLYEAALKTNPEVEEPKDRPALINPTAGVSPRPALGRAVWVKDDKHASGGVWIAATEQDRLDSGVAVDGCLLEHELEPGSEYARQWAIAKSQGVGQALPRSSGPGSGSVPDQMSSQGLTVPQSLGDVQNTTNVNPQMNYDGMFTANNTTVTGSGSEIVTVSENDLPWMKADT